MKTLHEIFKNKPELLETDEVKEFIDQFKYQFRKMQSNHENERSKILDAIFHSEFYLKDGKKCEEVFAEIVELML